jgi:DNA-binding beta-propeller fold protein YncE
MRAGEEGDRSRRMKMRITIYLLLLAVSSFAQTTLTFMDSMTVMDGEAPYSSGVGVTSVAVSPDNKNVYVTGDTSIIVYDRNLAIGALSFAACIRNTKGVIEGLRGITTLIVSPDGKNVYVSAVEDHALTGFKRDVVTGGLTYLFTIKGDTAGRPVSIAMTTDNKFVYGGVFHDAAVSIIQRDTATGLLNEIAVVKNDPGNGCTLQGVMKFAISPDNKNVYVSEMFCRSLTIYHRDRVTGGLSIDTCIRNQVKHIAVSPDNKSVYMTTGSALVAFDRDVSTGELTEDTGVYCDGGSFENMSSSIAVSPDNKDIYFSNGRYLEVVHRDLSGKLSRVTEYKDITRARDIAVSPDNKNVYVTGSEKQRGVLGIFCITQPAKTRSPNTEPPHRMQKFSTSCSGRTCRIGFFLNRIGLVDVSLFDARGKFERKLIHDHFAAGKNTVNADISTIRAGMYFLRISGGNESVTGKIVMIKNSSR